MPEKFRSLMCLICLLALLPLWALAEDASAGEAPIPPARPVPEYVEWLLDTARGELGYTEEKSGVTKYGTWAGDPAAEWCAEFLCWCVNRVDKQHGTKLQNRQYPYYTGTNVGRDWFLTQGRYIARRGAVPGWGAQWLKGEKRVMESGEYIPQPGDWVFFSDNALGDTSHVAMVEYCAYDAQGNIQVHVIEGNNPDSVARNVYGINHWAIQGYGTVHEMAEITLRFGNSGEKVVQLQKELVEAGMLEAQYTTGRYGAITTQAIKEIQKWAGLEETGIANLPTRLALQDYISALSADNPENWAIQD